MGSLKCKLCAMLNALSVIIDTSGHPLLILALMRISLHKTGRSFFRAKQKSAAYLIFGGVACGAAQLENSKKVMPFHYNALCGYYPRPTDPSLAFPGEWGIFIFTNNSKQKI